MNPFPETSKDGNLLIVCGKVVGVINQIVLFALERIVFCVCVVKRILLVPFG